MPLKLPDRKKKTQKNIQWEKFRQHKPDDSNLNGRNSTGTYAGTCLIIGERITLFFGTSGFRYRKLRKIMILIEILQAIKFRWVLDGSKSTGSSVRMWVSGTKGNKTKYSAFEAHVQKCKEQSIERDSRAGSSNFYFVFLIEQFQPLLLEDALENQRKVFTWRPFYLVRSLNQGIKPKTLIEQRLSKRTSFLADHDATNLIVNCRKWFWIARKNTENQNLWLDQSILYRCHDRKLTCQGWKRSGSKTLVTRNFF